MQPLQPYPIACKDRVDEFLNEIDSIDYYPTITRNNSRDLQKNKARTWRNLIPADNAHLACSICISAEIELIEDEKKRKWKTYALHRLSFRIYHFLHLCL